MSTLPKVNITSAQQLSIIKRILQYLINHKSQLTYYDHNSWVDSIGGIWAFKVSSVELDGVVYRMEEDGHGNAEFFFQLKENGGMSGLFENRDAFVYFVGEEFSDYIYGKHVGNGDVDQLIAYVIEFLESKFMNCDEYKASIEPVLSTEVTGLISKVDRDAMIKSHNHKILSMKAFNAKVNLEVELACIKLNKWLSESKNYELKTVDLYVPENEWHDAIKQKLIALLEASGYSYSLSEYDRAHISVHLI